MILLNENYLSQQKHREVEDEKEAGEEKDQDARLPSYNSKSRVSFDPSLALNELRLNETDNSMKKAKSSPLSPQQLAQLPQLEDETKRWMAQGFTKDQAERAAKKVIDDKRRAMLMESHPHNSMVSFTVMMNLMCDILNELICQF